LRDAIALALLVLGRVTAGWIGPRRSQPYVREQAIGYLQDRFGTSVELRSLLFAVSFLSPWHPRRALSRITGDGLKLPYRDRPDLPPLITTGKFRVDTEFGAWDPPRCIHDVRLDDLEINVPPRQPSAPKSANAPAAAAPGVVVDTIHANGIEMRIFSADAAKLPRVFEIHALTLKGTAPGVPLKYQAVLTNPRPRELSTLRATSDRGSGGTPARRRSRATIPSTTPTSPRSIRLRGF
jgi:hypothetical protein